MNKFYSLSLAFLMLIAGRNSNAQGCTPAAGNITLNNGLWVLVLTGNTNIITKDIVVPANVTATINSSSFVGIPGSNNTLFMAKGKRIYIQAKGFLTLNGINIVPCDTGSNGTWGGIVVDGDSTKKQEFQWQGRLHMSNVLIAKAEKGVMIGRDSAILASRGGGGMVDIRYSKFLNCKYSIIFQKHRDPTNPYFTRNVAVVDHNDFEWNENFPDSFFLFNDTLGDQVGRVYAHITLKDVYGVDLSGNSFKNTIHWHRWKSRNTGIVTIPKIIGDIGHPNFIPRGIGILMWNASALVRRSGPCTYSNKTWPDSFYSNTDTSCYTCIGRDSYFEGLSIGIEIAKSDTNQHIDITGSNFVNNVYGIRAIDYQRYIDSLVHNIFINRCQISAWTKYIDSTNNYIGFYDYFPGRRHYGISLVLPNGFTITDNNIYYDIETGRPNGTKDSMYTSSTCPNVDDYDFGIKIDAGTNGTISNNSIHLNLLEECVTSAAAIKIGNQLNNVSINCNKFDVNTTYNRDRPVFDILFDPYIYGFRETTPTNKFGIPYVNASFGSAANGVSNKFSDCNRVSPNGKSKLYRVGFRSDWMVFFNNGFTNECITPKVIYYAQDTLGDRAPHCKWTDSLYFPGNADVKDSSFLRIKAATGEQSCSYHDHCGYFKPYVNTSNIPAGVANIYEETKYEFTIQPNPANQSIRIGYFYDDEAMAIIIDSRGSIVKQLKLNKNSLTDVNADSFSDGIYIVQVISKNLKFAAKRVAIVH